MFDFKQKGTINITGNIGSFVSFFISQTGKKILFFYDNEDEAFLNQEEIEYYAKKQVHIFPVYADKVFEKEDEGKRIGFLYHLITDETFIGLFPYSAVGHTLPSSQTLSAVLKTIKTGDIVFQEELIAYLEHNGYERTSLIFDVGHYAKRGSIIDVFPPSYKHPVRIEFLGDQVLSIRHFNLDTQRSLTELGECSLTYANRTQNNDDVTIRDYLHEGIIFVHNGFDLITENLLSSPALLKSWDDLLHASLNINISGIASEAGETSIQATSNEDLRRLFNENKTEVFKILSGRFKNEWLPYKYIYIFANNEHQGKRLQEIFLNYNISLPVLSEISYPNVEREWGIVIGPVRRGFRTNNIIVLTEEDIVGKKKRVVKKRWNGLDEFLTSFKDLNIGEWVVHIEHGIGIYKGIIPLQINGHTRDFVLIEYQDGDKLYVPVDDLHLVQKFIGSEKIKPKIDRLGSSLWQNTKKKVKKQIENIARELLETHAERQMIEGHSYPPEDELFREMESRFEFDETEGQLKAIEDVLNDMKNTKPMDRLVCGDVGFGKTEVALRASFKAVLDNKQVALLAPTTILAQQHYATFQERLAGYPVSIETLSRFRTKEEQRAITERVKKGAVDIIIGTHRLLQKDIVFRDLGLLIIDEEQRFGVKHKEKLKIYKKNIDVLTLSATPIPRTLYMATIGIKDLSVIDTPPLDRFAVKTSVVQFNDNIIRKAVMDEINRGGQVFFVHNYIHNIGVIYDHLANLLPDVKIAVAHGRMEGKRLEKIMIDFIDKKYEILLSTNIIESGLDISNVNTIFINNAHKMGLADLYQLRGRVGRSEKQAYAYLLVPKNEKLSRDAILRLKIIEEMTGLGSGFHIANYDLEIRGAGNLIGKEQSGNVNLIGFELYCTMLEDTMKNLRNEPVSPSDEYITEVVLPIDAFIPDDYIADTNQKLLMYKRLSKIRENQELENMKEEFLDRYGIIPTPLMRLFEIISLKCFLISLKIKKIDYTGKKLSIYITEHTPLNMEKLLGKTMDAYNNLKLLPDGKIVVQTEKKADEIIHFIRNLLMDIITL